MNREGSGESAPPEILKGWPRWNELWQTADSKVGGECGRCKGRREVPVYQFSNASLVSRCVGFKPCPVCGDKQ
jgi:hypothetical protein